MGLNASHIKASELAERIEAYDPAKSPDNRADELDLHQSIVLETGEGSMNPPFEQTFVRSLDAAMALVPEGWGVSLTRYINTAAQARVTKDSGLGWRVEAATPALALCAAALKARCGE